MHYRGAGPTLEDLYSQWPHGKIKLKLITDTLLTSHETKFADGKEASESRPDKGKLVEQKAVTKTGAGSSNQQKLNKQKTNKKSKKRGKKNKG